jgi:oxygen-independent coproporphyrinogen III oxidase
MPTERLTDRQVQSPGLYLHIPFCLSKCRYCNFFSVTELQKIPDFLTALFQEALLQRDVFKSFDTLYIGGGTPSILTPDQLADLLSHLRQNFDIADDAELTLEINPADIDVPMLEQIRALGINRLNIGVQSFENDVLNFLGRRHNSTQAIQAITAARQAGFENFGIDLIYGIPGQSRQAWKKTLEQVVSLSIPHLSC